MACLLGWWPRPLGGSKSSTYLGHQWKEAPHSSTMANEFEIYMKGLEGVC